MPFKSKSQRQLCYAKYSQDKKAGKTPSWDCPKWDKETSNIEALPWRKSSNGAIPRQLTPQSKVYVGPKGGKYILKGKRKIYLSSI